MAGICLARALQSEQRFGLILYRTGEGAWTPVDVAQESYGVKRGALNTVRFTPVEADAVRLEVTLREGKSAGLFEWEVE